MMHFICKVTKTLFFKCKGMAICCKKLHHQICFSFCNLLIKINSYVSLTPLWRCKSSFIILIFKVSNCLVNISVNFDLNKNARFMSKTNNWYIFQLLSSNVQFFKVYQNLIIASPFFCTHCLVMFNHVKTQNEWYW
jgi:hypothetical protein